ncbi:Predicted arabinose efflux permease, MFS family [Dyella sp. OK004]|uniref:MFS transporter n=1 Tax=Dyella sp. OK004 TaxID=1855292 RepID=UPI0008EED56F|nr:MFS transporter [Dyella sp. OK004]SFS20070.1 Predicted arabinose efflux permease, MFS family [Dyella sp. OK004]
MSNRDTETGSTWAPFKSAIFRWLWLAMLASNIGTWINDTTSGWMMTSLSASPLLVSLVQTAGSLPILVLALVAGALADIVDRRRYLIVTQSWMLIVATVLSVTTWLHLLTPEWLLLLTLGLGIGSAMSMPAMSSTTPEIVPPAQLPAAVAMTSIGFNASRAIGPAIGGLILLSLGPAFAYALNALSFLAVIGVLLWWKREPVRSDLPAEQFVGALRAGVRYVVNSADFRGVLLRAVLFFLFATATWSLLPFYVRGELKAGPALYGVILGAAGLGAIVGGLLLPIWRRWFGPERQVLAASVLYALTMVSMAYLRNPLFACAAMLVIGACWITVLSALQVSAQTTVPAWVRARALSIYITAFSAGLVAGSAGWGWVASHHGIPFALVAAALGLALSSIATVRVSLKGKTPGDLVPSAHWPLPIPSEEIAQDRGPVLITVAYSVRPECRAEFLKALHELGRTRRRDGAIFWGIFQNIEQSEDFIESFVVPSWLEHLRQHERVSHDDQRLQLVIAALMSEGQVPAVHHYVGGRQVRPVP